MIEIIPEWALSPMDEVQIVDLLRRCFETDFGGRSYFQQRPHLRLVWRDEGQIIGHMAVLLRAVRLDGGLVDVAGLADVATAPTHRGKGIAQALLTETIVQMRRSMAQYFLLFGTAKLYGANGFGAAPNLLTYVEMRGAVTGQVKTEVARELRVLPLHGQGWPIAATVDLMGTLF